MLRFLVRLTTQRALHQCHIHKHTPTHTHALIHRLVGEVSQTHNPASLLNHPRVGTIIFDPVMNWEPKQSVPHLSLVDCCDVTLNSIKQPGDAFLIIQYDCSRDLFGVPKFNDGKL